MPLSALGDSFLWGGEKKGEECRAAVIGVRFKNVGKVYYFAPGEHTLKIGDKVIVFI